MLVKLEAIVRQKLAEMELNGRQYQTWQNVDTEATFRLHELLPHETARHIRPSGFGEICVKAHFYCLLRGGMGGNFPCAESQIVACWEMGWETIVRRLA